MSLSTKRLLSSESGSAIVGFVAGAPFVLLLFVGFLEVTHMAWKSVIISTQEKVRLLDIAQSETEFSAGAFLKIVINDVSLIKTKGSEWNLWRIQE